MLCASVERCNYYRFVRLQNINVHVIGNVRTDGQTGRKHYTFDPCIE